MGHAGGATREKTHRYYHPNYLSNFLFIIIKKNLKYQRDLSNRVVCVDGWFCVTLLSHFLMLTRVPWFLVPDFELHNQNGVKMWMAFALGTRGRQERERIVPRSLTLSYFWNTHLLNISHSFFLGPNLTFSSS